jgi:hypothetical protein
MEGLPQREAERQESFALDLDLGRSGTRHDPIRSDLKRRTLDSGGCPISRALGQERPRLFHGGQGRSSALSGPSKPIFVGSCSVPAHHPSDFDIRRRHSRSVLTERGVESIEVPSLLGIESIGQGFFGQLRLLSPSMGDRERPARGLRGGSQAFVRCSSQLGAILLHGTEADGRRGVRPPGPRGRISMFPVRGAVATTRRITSPSVEIDRQPFRTRCC